MAGNPLDHFAFPRKNLDDPTFLFQSVQDQLRQMNDVVRAENDVDLRIGFPDLFDDVRLLSHATADEKQAVFFLRFSFFQRADFAEYLVFRVFADRAGIENHDIGFGRIGSAFIADFQKNPFQILRIQHVRLTPVRPNEIRFSGSEHFQPGRNDQFFPDEFRRLFSSSAGFFQIRQCFDDNFFGHSASPIRRWLPFYFFSIRNLIAVFSFPSMVISLNDGMT